MHLLDRWLQLDKMPAGENAAFWDGSTLTQHHIHKNLSVLSKRSVIDTASSVFVHIITLFGGGWS